MRKTPAKKPNKKPWRAPIEFPDSLPISARKDEIAKAIQQHQVVVIAGETGSGKTTQIPKICLSLGYGEHGQIAHTQPRRIAARSVANRIAMELKTQLGDGVGYQIRFNDTSSENTRIKLMTDGVLLAEFQHDPLLKKYDVIIIDEAHERSLNIDFLLGLLKPLCKKRPELRVIITSATIDLDKFAAHFAMGGNPAPIIEVSGRTFPVETRYREPAEETSSLPDTVVQVCDDIIRGEAKGEFNASGDILVFCAGEREIRETALALRRSKLQVNVLPLYSRLSVAEQNKVFQPSQQRKVVLATNVAETSLTVPGIAYVIDPGLARISRYSFRSKIQRLPVEPISQASAEQRKGRSGRVANGVCIRLYSEQDFDQRPAFTPAEILRSNLAAVVLKMLRLRIRKVSDFEFIDQPDQRSFNDAFKLLTELGAIDSRRQLTRVGRQMSDLPIDPKYARILIAAEKHNCLRDALIVISALSIQDPRERPADKQQAADQKHQELHHPQSDFFGYLHVWQAISTNRESMSNTQFKSYCRERYWSVARVFEWRELFRQLLLQCKRLGFKISEWERIDLPDPQKKKPKPGQSFSTRYENLHRALISGLVGNVAHKSVQRDYLGTRNRQIALFPGSAIAKNQPQWIMAAEFLETSRVFAHTVAQINPLWVAQEASHLCRYSYSAPHFHARSGGVKAYRKTLLFGLTLRDKEKVNYAPINASESREIFIQQALVEGAYKPTEQFAEFATHNQSLIADIEKLETKVRKRNLLVDESAIQRFFSQRLPENINSRQALEAWLKQGNQDALKLDRDTLMQQELSSDHVAQFPDSVDILGKEIRLEYKFNPGRQSDGVTMIIPISVLAPFPEHVGDWLVPGLLREKCTALIKTLPKPIRRNFAPAADAINRIADQLHASELRLVDVLAELLYRSRGVKVTGGDFAAEKLDPFYQMNYRVLDVDGSLVEEGRNLPALKANYAHAVQKSVHASNAVERQKLERHDIQRWDFGELRDTIEYQHQGMTVSAHPMLKINSDQSISLLIHDDQKVARYHSHHAIIELAKRELSSTTQRQSLKYLRKELMSLKPKSKQEAKGLSSLGQHLKAAVQQSPSRTEWSEKLINASLYDCCFKQQVSTITSAQAFNEALADGGRKWVETALNFEPLLNAALDYRDSALASINAIQASDLRTDEIMEELKAQIYSLFEPSFLSYTSPNTLKQYPRYLRAIESRVEKLRFDSKRKQEELALDALQKSFDCRVENLANPNFDLDFVFLSYPKLAEFKIMLEEWRVSIFAQHLRAKIPVSEKRLKAFWQRIGN